jgi:hypothetical protein
MMSPPSPWLIPGIIARLCELHALDGKQKLSFSAIRDALNAEFGTALTRNAIAGCVHRVKLPCRPSPLKRIAEMTKVRIDAPIVPVEAQLPPTPTGLMILQLCEGVCRWPMGELLAYPPFVYCGHDVTPGRPYCGEHCTLAYHAPLVRWS